MGPHSRPTDLLARYKGHEKHLSPPADGPKVVGAKPSGDAFVTICISFIWDSLYLEDLPAPTIPDKRRVDGAEPIRQKRQYISAEADPLGPSDAICDSPPHLVGFDDPVQCHTWVRPVWSNDPPCGKTVLVLSPTEYLYVPINEQDEQEFVQFIGCDINPSGYCICTPQDIEFFTLRHLDPVVPTEDILSAYQPVRTLETICIPVTWQTYALTPGARAVVVSGAFTGSAGCIVAFHKQAGEIHAELVQEPCDDVTPCLRFVVKLSDIVRHALDIPGIPFMYRSTTTF
ncbi:hypothetical protein K438DRAFT_1946717 [Mycena galopus ATCC 62051]|nr:hypothetical protein K438DRAFT_1946717 [Mycena galopus ATCC 62051]